VGKPERKIPVGRPAMKWEDNIKMDLSKIGWGGIYCVHLLLDRDLWKALVNTVMNLRVE
jgi:hypothetical protein